MSLTRTLERVGTVSAARMTVVEASFTRPADATPYADGDAVADSTSAPNDLEFLNCATASGRGGRIVSATLIDSVFNTQPTGFDLFLFDTAPTPTNDNAAFALTDANANDCIGVVSFVDSTHGVDAGANNHMFARNDLNIGFVCADTTLYGLLVVRGVYTPSSGEIFTIRLAIAQD